MTVEVYGKTRLYEAEDLPGILREIADGIEKKGNPHNPTYGSEDLKRALEMFKKKAKIVDIEVRV